MIRTALEVPEARAQLLKGTPLARVGNADDVAAAALFLASDEAGFISGAELVIDGAFSVAGSARGIQELSK